MSYSKRNETTGEEEEPKTRVEMETKAPPPPNHQMDADDDDENVKQLKECSSFYLSLQDCLVDSNRDWKSCQKHVQALKECHERRMKK